MDASDYLTTIVSSYTTFSRLVVRTYFQSDNTPGRLTPRRFVVMTLFLPVLFVFNSAHWIGFLLDELLFPGYRKVEVISPLFIVGVPRSGTSYLHRVIAQDSERFTTLKLWELLLAPSICERKCWLLLGKIDRMVGGPCARLIRKFEQAATNDLNVIHPIGLHSPEEDYFLLVPLFACYLLILPFPYDTPIAKSFLKRPPRPIASPPRSLCYCGRLTLEKNIPEILAAAQKMPAKRFTFAGDGPLRSVVARAAAQHDNIRYIGWVSRDGVRSVIDEADIMLLPSVVEAFGTIALEAMSRRRLVLVTAGCGIVNWPTLSSGVCVMKAGEFLYQAIERICSGDHENHHQKVRFAYRAAHAFNALTIKQWTRLFREVCPSPAPC